MRLSYFSLFRSHLQCSIIDWVRAYKTAPQPVKMLQNQILKYMTFTNRKSSGDNIFKLLKILKVSDLYQLNLTKFMYKHNVNILPCSFDTFQNYTAFMIMAQDNKFHKIFITSVLELIIAKKLQFVAHVVWDVYLMRLKLYHYICFHIKRNCNCLLGIDSYVRYICDL